MDSSEQRRKRKRAIRSSPSSPPHLLSVRSLILCFSFLTFLYLLSYRIPSSPSFFRPVLVISSLLLSSASSRTDYFHQDYLKRGSFYLPVKIEHRVLFPDHLLLLVSKYNRNGYLVKIPEMECIYRMNLFNNTDSGGIISSFKGNVLSVDEYDEDRIIVRCPLPPVNYSAAVHLQGMGSNGVNLLVEGGQTVNSWEKLVYGSRLDGDTVVVFAKGLNLRPDRESDPNQFTCHFGLGAWEKDSKLILTSRAVTAAQEVVRCLLPRSMMKNPDKARGIQVTLGVMPHIHSSAHEHVLMPSVAKILNPKPEGLKPSAEKYELCVCTMVWNQASALREWIIYHAWLGVERWFIYDNNSDDGIKEVIEELEQENYNISRHVWPWIKTQEAGFSHCVLRAKDECNWVSFMDVDEFFYFPFSTSQSQRNRKLGFPRQDSLKTLVANFSSLTAIAEIRTTCHSFGPSGLSSPPKQGVTAGYTCRLQSPERHKPIVRPDALDITLLNVVHHFHLRKGFDYLNLPRSTAVINHYKYQAWEVFRKKFYRRVATYVADWQENQNEGSRDRAPGLGTEAIEPPNWPLQFCEVWDTGLRDFVLANFADPATGLLPWERSAA